MKLFYYKILLTCLFYFKVDLYTKKTRVSIQRFLKEMETDKKHIKTIRSLFGKMKTKEDLLVLINYTKVVLYGEKAIPFTLNQLNYHYTPKANRKRYFQFTIKKKSGTERTISAPNNGLKEIQKCINLIFQLIYEPNSAANGFVPGKSIVDNALVHAGSLYVYNIDLKDFFPSIDQARIWGRLKHAPFNLNEAQNRSELANIIASLCCHEMEVERPDNTGAFVKTIKSVLPQGAPTSPTLSNIICERLDIRLSGAAKRFGLKYSRYADDITFSSMHNKYQKDGEFLAEIQRIITEQNFHIKESKTRLQKQGFRQEVTGLVVNDKPNVNKRYISQLRMWIYYWEQYGYEKANSFFKPKYIADKGHIKKGTSSLENVLAGKLEYLKMVKGEKHTVYLNLSERIKKLSSQKNPLNEVLSIWENQGIEKAMEFYYSNATSNIEINTFTI
jgi:RNA-directed DNA polymerase